MSVKPFLMFSGKANDAIKQYVDVIPNSKIQSITHYDEGELAGMVQQALIVLDGQEVMAIDSPIKHDFTFTPAINLFVSLEDKAQVDKVFAKLSEGGKIMMELGEYPFSKKFGWTEDRWGVSWQVSVALK